MKAIFYLFVILLGLGWNATLARAKEGANLDAGKAIYGKRCVACHAQQGQGMTSMQGIPDMGDPVYMANRSDEELLQIIANGAGGGRMPAWKGTLTEQDLKNVLAYIRTFSSP